MMRGLSCACIALVVAGCSTPAVIYGPNDLDKTEPSGAVTALRDLLPADGTPVRLVFVHGVGDHCSGYALNPQNGWLDDKTRKAMGLRPVQGASKAGSIDVGIFVPGAPAQGRSHVEFSTATYTLRVPGTTRDVDVEAIEITWSTLTQWIKSNQLGYDSPTTTPHTGSLGDCPQAPDTTIASTKAPPSRVWLNRVIKEEVFDRSLADAVLYSGTYQSTIERGVAEALCHAVTDTANTQKCQWPGAPQTSQQRFRYFFVTHSLGSRIIYDMFIHYSGYLTVGRPNPFSQAERDQAADFISATLAHTPAFYMMANQLALIGLSNVPPTANSGSGLHPWLELFEFQGNPNGVEPHVEGVAPRTFGNVIQFLGDAHSRAMARQGEEPTQLRIVAFNDTDDLLTWHVPPWYANAAAGTPGARPTVSVVNAFVQNASRLLIVESPAPAHDNYFINPEVWKVISCGATSGAVLACPD